MGFDIVVVKGCLKIKFLCCCCDGGCGGISCGGVVCCSVGGNDFGGGGGGCMNFSGCIGVVIVFGDGFFFLCILCWCCFKMFFWENYFW